MEKLYSLANYNTSSGREVRAGCTNKSVYHLISGFLISHWSPKFGESTHHWSRSNHVYITIACAFESIIKIMIIWIYTILHFQSRSTIKRCSTFDLQLIYIDTNLPLETPLVLWFGSGRIFSSMTITNIVIVQFVQSVIDHHCRNIITFRPKFCPSIIRIWTDQAPRKVSHVFLLRNK